MIPLVLSEHRVAVAGSLSRGHLSPALALLTPHSFHCPNPPAPPPPLQFVLLLKVVWTGQGLEDDVLVMASLCTHLSMLGMRHTLYVPKHTDFVCTENVFSCV